MKFTAKTELQLALKKAGNPVIVAADIGLINKRARKIGIELTGEDYDVSRFVSLKRNHTEEELEAFFDALDFDYDPSYGIQELHGTVWLHTPETGEMTWLSRGEYDGSEWWEHNFVPTIPDRLM